MPEPASIDPVVAWFARFGVDEDLIAPALAAATTYGADDAELYFQHSSSTSQGSRHPFLTPKKRMMLFFRRKVNKSI